MSFTLLVFNPSPYLRKGHVAVPWQGIYERTLIEENDLVLYQESGIPIPFQVDVVDPNDPSKKTLLFSLDSEIPPAKNHYSPSTVSVILDKHKSRTSTDAELRLEIVSSGLKQRGVKFINNRLELYFNLVPELDGRGKWYSGAATSVRLRNEEVLDALDAFWDPMFHDMERRCIQLDYLETFLPPWQSELQQRVSLVDEPYVLVSQSVGPVRASITIASNPFEYGYLDPSTGRIQVLDCSIYRVISLYAGADYLIEELFIKGMPRKGQKRRNHVQLRFTPHYFAYLGYFVLGISRLESIPDWFAVYNNIEPFRGYGFATNGHIGPIMNPHPGFPDSDKEMNSISWHLSPSMDAKCVHLFMDFKPVADNWQGDSYLGYEVRKRDEAKKYFESRIGHIWYELIYKPLWAEIID